MSIKRNTYIPGSLLSRPATAAGNPKLPRASLKVLIYTQSKTYKYLQSQFTAIAALAIAVTSTISVTAIIFPVIE